MDVVAVVVVVVTLSITPVTFLPLLAFAIFCFSIIVWSENSNPFKYVQRVFSTAYTGHESRSLDVT